MIAGKKVLGLIPARGGSKGVVGKNLRQVGGRSLLEWTVRAAQKSQTIDHLVLSSDDTSIMQAARQLGCAVPFRRPKALAEDNTPGIDPVLHALEVLPEQYDYIVLLQPTSPLRIAEDIDRAMGLCHQSGAPSVVSVGLVEQQPHWMFHLHENGTMTPLMDPKTRTATRQELPPLHALNGAVYVARVAALLQSKSFFLEGTRAIVMPQERSLDIDTEGDLALAQAMMEYLHKQKKKKNSGV